MTTKNFVVKNGLTTGNITLDALTDIITTTGNVSAANLLTGGQVSATGNITGNNLSIGNIVSAGGNLTAGNITTAGNANLGNIITTGLFTSSGNIAFTGSNAYFSNVSNIHIPGGTANYVLTTDGSGNVSWEPTGRGDANVAGANTEIQFNDDGNLGASSNLTFNKSSNTFSTYTINVSGNLNFTGPNAYFSNVANIHILGGTANYVLTTDGTGNVSWEPTGRGDANVAGNNTEVQFNNDGNLGASNAFTFNTTTNALSATYFVGDGSNLANIAGANVTGTVANANHACTANVVTDGTQSNITAVGTLTSLSSSGNITGANLLTGGILSANGNVTGNYILGNGFYLTGVSTNSTSILNGNSNVVVEANSNVTVGVAGNANVVVFTGTGVNVTGYVDLTANLTAANANLGNVVTANYFIGSGNNLSNIQAANITGTVANANYAAYAGDVVNASQPNITSVGTLSSLSVSGNANVSNVNTGIISASGNLSVANANLGNAATANYFIGNGSSLSSLTGANVTGTVANATHASTANTVVDANQSNITSVGTLTNLSISGNANVGNDVNVSGNAVITGNLVVGGNTVYINVETIRVEDPIIELGGGPNGAPLTTDDGKDRGTLLHYYAGTAIDAFMGWDESNTEFALGSNVTVTNDVVTFNTFGNLRLAGLIANTGNFSGNISAANANLGNAVNANYFIGNGYYLTDLNVSNIGTVANANYAAYAGNITINAQPNITSVGTLSSLSVSGNANTGNVNTGIVSATGNITGANANLGNTVTANYFIGSGNNLSNIQGSNVTGAVANATHASTANTVVDANQSNITSVGTLTSVSVSGNANTGNINTGIVSASGNVTGANLLTGGIISATGNITTANYFIGNGYYLTGIDAGVQDEIANGNSNVYIPTANGNVTITVSGNANIVTVTGTGVNVFGYTNITGNLTAANANLGNAVTANFFIGSGNNLSNIQVGNVSGLGNIATVNLDGNASNVLYGNGVFSGAASPYGNSNVASFLASFGSNTITTTGNVSVGNIIGNGQALTGINGSNVTGQVGNAAIAGTVYTNAQPNITSTGTLTGLAVSGNASFTGANVYISNIANFKIPGGSANYVISTDGLGNLSWQAGGSGTPGGSDTQLQFNDANSFGGTANVVYNKTSNTLSVTGNAVFSGANVNLGASTNLHISGGTSGQLLSTDGTGNLSFVDQIIPQIYVDNFTGNGVETNFTLSTTPSNVDATTVNYNGATLLKSSYSIAGSVLTFSSPPANASLIEVTSTVTTGVSFAGGGVRTYTGDGSNVNYTVTSGTSSTSVLVTLDGVVQTPTTDYSIAGSTLTFTTAPDNGVAILIRETAVLQPISAISTGKSIAMAMIFGF